jgi:acetyl esterase/lipase
MLGARLLGGALRASLLFSPRPAALAVRKVFAANGATMAEALERHAPPDVTARLDVRYDEGRDTVLDVYRPAAATTPLPLVVWIHGGGFVGGAKEELSGYFKLLANEGYAVVAPSYSLAPEHRYPTPTRQAMQAAAFVQAERESLLVDPTRIVLAGDSAGAHIAAQLAAIVTTPGYADAVGVPAAIGRHELRGVVLACGPYDLGLSGHSSSAFGELFVRTVLWAYSGTRNYRDDPAFAPWSITDHVTPAFPPALVTVGNADPLRLHSERLAESLRTEGVEVETVFFRENHEPPLGHEYQFDLDGEAGRLFLERVRAFLGAHLA